MRSPWIARALKPPAVFAALAMLSPIACGTDDDVPRGEYIVVSRPASPPDRKHFQAIEIRSQAATPIVAIRETTGRVYQASMSSLPECNGKVVAGYFSEDTMFVTTRVLRDTAVATVGR
jgi:hypothetical protein